nr:hypothetical protein [uncultured Oscillibacter sp.]
MNINRAPTVKTGMPSGGRSVFAKFAKVTSTPGNGEGRQNGFTVQEAEQPVCGLVIQLLSRIGVNVAHHTKNVALL